MSVHFHPVPMLETPMKNCLRLVCQPKHAQFVWWLMHRIRVNIDWRTQNPAKHVLHPTWTPKKNKANVLSLLCKHVRFQNKNAFIERILPGSTKTYICFLLIFKSKLKPKVQDTRALFHSAKRAAQLFWAEGAWSFTCYSCAPLVKIRTLLISICVVSSLRRVHWSNAVPWLHTTCRLYALL